MFSQSVFETKKERNEIKFEEADVVFVADLFTDEYSGGAELTTEALFGTSPYKTYKLKSNELTEQLIQQGVNKTWVFFNFTQMNLNLIPMIVANLFYFITEYDYKFCKYRSIELHKKETGKECDCHNLDYGKFISSFFAGTEKIFWMSDKQKERYQERFPFLTDEKSTRLSSVFNVKDLEYIEELCHARKENGINGKWAIVGSDSWIKGVEQSKKSLSRFLHEDEEYDVLQGLSYSELLKTLSKYNGLCFQPLGGDTCPRIVIEAKLLGLELLINKNVQHLSEEWVNLETDGIEAYLLNGHKRFWDEIERHLNREIKLSGYTTVKNVITSDYPWEQSIQSMLEFCDEVVVLDGGSDDGTYESLLEWANKEIKGCGKLIVKQFKRDWNDPRFAMFDGANKAIARTICTGDWCWQQDVDEIVHEDDYKKIKPLCRQMPKALKILCLPVIEYWGSNEKVRVDVNPWKWRLTRNDTHITHGIPAQHRRYDKSGHVYSAGSDGCDYVHNDNYQPIPHSTFYTPDLHQVRIQALEGDKKSLEVYQSFMNKVVNQLPGVYHYSWYDISRKIYTYKNYWSKHWTSMFNKTIEDTAENNMFFNKKWSEVTDDEIKNLAQKMEKELGGWVFHSKIDFSKKTPWISIKRSEPELSKEWTEKRGK
jgi:glycosyltransferase involved in cell wall biosynthesis